MHESLKYKRDAQTKHKTSLQFFSTVYSLQEGFSNGRKLTLYLNKWQSQELPLVLRIRVLYSGTAHIEPFGNNCKWILSIAML